ncbi:hypothetical protein ACFVSK_17515 [Cellulosimicrobium cellulans]|uniref:hypothetical protein n=1 Tax=Cellulosimicrobium cellulans TaxID=1710 RepID=UPI0036E627A8
MEVSDSVFLLYVGLLALAGIIQLVIAGIGFGASGATRLLSGAFGLGFLGYAIYLAFFFAGGSFAMFWYAFVAPVAMIAQVVKNRRERQATQPAPVATQPPAPVDQPRV